MKKRICLILCCLILLNLFAGCKSKGIKTSNANLDFSSSEKQYSISFQSDDKSEELRLSIEKADAYADFISDISPDYFCSEFYGTDECYGRIFTDSSVKNHAFSALDGNGNLTAEHLLEIAKANNQKFFEESRTAKDFYKEPDDEFMLSICNLIVDTIDEIKNRYPDIDYDRVYCNLGNLKIFYKLGLLAYAQVTVDMIMQLSNSMLQVVDVLNGDSAIRDVVIHEIMHIVQFGCSCEKTEHCERHVGFTYLWDDVKFQGNDWSWLVEGSAELNMYMLTGDNPITYQNKINYIQSLNLATFLKKTIPADYVQTLSFYDNPNKLFELFGAKSEKEITEIANLMGAIQALQEAPDEFIKAYEDKYKVDTSQNAEMDKLRYTLKPAICVALAKSFYKNLAYALSEYDGVTVDDVFYLIRIFEAAMDYHLILSNHERDEINQPFLEKYKQIRGAFFEMLPTVDESTYLAYLMFSDEDETSANATFRWLDDSKKTFLLERTDFLKDRLNHKIV